MLPALSEAVPAAMEMPSVPSPVIPETDTVRCVVPEPVTVIVVALAETVLFKVTFNAVSVTESAPP